MLTDKWHKGHKTLGTYPKNHETIVECQLKVESLLGETKWDIINNVNLATYQAPIICHRLSTIYTNLRRVKYQLNWKSEM